MIKAILFVALGGATGSVARFLIGRWSQRPYSGSFPLGTWIVNILGCFLIGIFFGMATRNEQGNESLRLLLMTGFCGGFTTFSALSLESIHLLKEQKIVLFFVYIASSLLIGLLATFAGMRLIK